jgi:TonB family protein
MPRLARNDELIMATGAQTQHWSGASRRRAPRFEVQIPVDVTVLRSGVPDTLPGRALNLCERGMAAIVAGELFPGESVGIEMRLTSGAHALRTRATVRYQDKLRCGLEFIALMSEQRTAIRDWARNAKPIAIGPEIDTAPEWLTQHGTAPPQVDKRNKKAAFFTGKPSEAESPASAGRVSVRRSLKRHAAVWLTTLLGIAIALGAFLWRWNRGWEKLESGLNEQTAIPQEQVSAEAMEKLLIHRVEPLYPPEARAAKLEGVIAVDIVVGRDGSVVRMHALNGPDILAKAATDALRWWKFQPYLVNGQPTIVETTVAVEFKQ